MEAHKRPDLNIGKPLHDKFEKASNSPIIDIIRHGETTRKQNKFGFHASLPLDTSNSGFELSAENLDLTDEGIATIEETANQLADLIDKEKEMILIVSSPSWRTHSSALVLEKILRERGVSILNEGKIIKFFNAINQHSSFFDKILVKLFGDNKTTREVKRIYKEQGFKSGIDAANKTFGIDINEKMREAEGANFKAFLRHMTNIQGLLSPKTLEKLEGRKLRIVVLAHEETTFNFIKEVMPIGTLSQDNGQILEIIPRSESDDKQEYAKLYPPKKQNSKKTGLGDTEFQS
jgi:hypothetical protein